jgi:hypothetical protein
MVERPSPAASPKPSKKIPALVWIILAILVGWGVIAMIQNNGTVRTPNQAFPGNAGGTTGDAATQAIGQPATLPSKTDTSPGAIANPKADPAQVDSITPNETAPPPRAVTPGGSDQSDSPINAGTRGGATGDPSTLGLPPEGRSTQPPR